MEEDPSVDLKIFHEEIEKYSRTYFVFDIGKFNVIKNVVLFQRFFINVFSKGD